jgi:hypothetical protein
MQFFGFFPWKKVFPRHETIITIFICFLASVISHHHYVTAEPNRVATIQHLAVGFVSFLSVSLAVWKYDRDAILKALSEKTEESADEKKDD